jgi:hypothetical protein
MYVRRGLAIPGVIDSQFMVVSVAVFIHLVPFATCQAHSLSDIAPHFRVPHVHV